MIFEPVAGSASLAALPKIAARAGYHVRGQWPLSAQLTLLAQGESGFTNGSGICGLGKAFEPFGRLDPY